MFGFLSVFQCASVLEFYIIFARIGIFVPTKKKYKKPCEDDPTRPTLLLAAGVSEVGGAEAAARHGHGRSSGDERRPRKVFGRCCEASKGDDSDVFAEFPDAF